MDDVADEAVADNNVEFLAEQVVAFHVAGKVQAQSLAIFQRLLGQLVALGLLGADTQQPHAGLRFAEHFAGVNVTHNGVMHQVSGLALDVRPGVEQHEVAHLGRHHGGDAWTIHTRQGAQLDGGRGDQAARVPGGEDGIGLILLDQVHGHRDRAVFLAAQSLDRFVLH